MFPATTSMLNVSLAAEKIFCCHQFSGLSLIQQDNRQTDAFTAKAAAYNVSQTQSERERVSLLNECVCVCTCACV